VALDDIKRLDTEMGLRKPLTASLKALHKVLRDLEEYETDLDDVSGVQGVLQKTFQTDFPSFCFHVATGVGKTRLLGACIAYLWRTRGWTDFFILVPGQTIYNKFRGRDLVENAEKYVFAGLEDFPGVNVIDADNYRRVTQAGLFDKPINVYLFNIGKIFEPKKDKVFKFSREDADGLGTKYPEGFASYLAERRPVILMDEAHRYYAPASLAAMNRLKPRLGLEFTATPVHDGNQIYKFTLGEAIDAGYVKRPTVARVVNDHTPESEKEQAVLLDAARNHERKRGVLEAYCKNNDLPVVRPILLVTTEDTTHGDQVAAYLQGETQFTVKAKDGTETKQRLYDGEPFGKGTPLEGRYKGKVLVVHSKTEEDTDQAVRELETNQYEIVVHVNKLKEGLDVNNIYTLAVLRPSKSAVLTEQIIGRGLRLPFGEPVPDGADLAENVADLNALDILPHLEYEKVIAAADDFLRSRIQTKVIDRAAKKDPPTTEVVTVEPGDDPEYRIDIPLIEPRVVNTGKRLEVFPIPLGIDPVGDDEYRREIAHTDVRTKNVSLTQAAGGPAVTNAPAYLVRHVLDTCPETDPDDAPVLYELARAYLAQLRSDESAWAYAVELRKEPLLNDFIGQIRRKLDELAPVVQNHTGGNFQFKPWTKSVPLDYVAPARSDDDPAQEKVGVLIAGYRRTIYEKNHFDSKQEKWLADALEREANPVLRWVRLPTRQMRIGLSRSGYYPDFVAVIREKDGREYHYLLEVKAENKCDPSKPDPEVQAKYRAAQDWARAANGGDENGP
jgi:superfamily II DNA or RNA helicase